VTLWHLLWRVDPAQRARVYERLAALAPPPRGLDREAVVTLDSAALARWREDLRPLWRSESSSGWRRVLVRVGLVKPRALLSVRQAVAESGE
jgi:hypothetical protein